MDFIKSELKFNIYGEEVSLRLPTVKEALGFQDKLKEKSEFDATIEMLESLGMRKGLAENMELNHLEKLIGEVLGSGKKK